MKKTILISFLWFSFLLVFINVFIQKAQAGSSVSVSPQTVLRNGWVTVDASASQADCVTGGSLSNSNGINCGDIISGAICDGITCSGSTTCFVGNTDGTYTISWDNGVPGCYSSADYGVTSNWSSMSTTPTTMSTSAPFTLNIQGGVNCQGQTLTVQGGTCEPVSGDCGLSSCTGGASCQAGSTPGTYTINYGVGDCASSTSYTITSPACVGWSTPLSCEGLTVIGGPPAGNCTLCSEPPPANSITYTAGIITACNSGVQDCYTAGAGLPGQYKSNSENTGYCTYEVWDCEGVGMRTYAKSAISYACNYAGVQCTTDILNSCPYRTGNTTACPGDPPPPPNCTDAGYTCTASCNPADQKIFFCSSGEYCCAAPPTPTPPLAGPCSVATSPPVYNLGVGETGVVTASVISGLGLATVDQMRFGSYDTTIAAVNPISDPFSPYSTTVTGMAGGATAVWGTADLSDGRTCESTGATDTDINVSGPAPTPPPTSTPTPICVPTGCPGGSCDWQDDGCGNTIWCGACPGGPCSVTTSPPVYNLGVGETGVVTADVISGLGAATISQMRFGSYEDAVAAVNPISDSFWPYSTTVTAVAAGNTAVWGTADLSDGRTCESTGATDTDINVSGPAPTPPPANYPIINSFRIYNHETPLPGYSGGPAFSGTYGISGKKSEQQGLKWLNPMRIRIGAQLGAGVPLGTIISEISVAFYERSLYPPGPPTDSTLDDMSDIIAKLNLAANRGKGFVLRTNIVGSSLKNNASTTAWLTLLTTSPVCIPASTPACTGTPLFGAKKINFNLFPSIGAVYTEWVAYIYQESISKDYYTAVQVIDSGNRKTFINNYTSITQ